MLDCAVTISSLILVDMLALDLPFNGIILILELSQFWGLGLLPSSNETQILIFVSSPCDLLDPWCSLKTSSNICTVVVAGRAGLAWLLPTVYFVMI